ncbi:Tetratricopeptide TPR_2 repeat protein [Oscillochloris trichoides DG-6]|uniref:Tetratricopeptide TPR_2 repeat protein n=1 Tax=Oscillochloris trichoides DG-6 TaxID=765420 RepID=E1I9W0_9CHLR|nr:Tetratricopeptide TPR_2 repeat protein [Oscillochloris trichoides DG-6]
MRMRRKLQEKAVELAAVNHWADALEINRQILTLGEDPDTYNRIGKALMELGQFSESHSAYMQTLRLFPTNAIARKNIQRLDALLSRGFDHGQENRSPRQQVDMRLFITETGRTALTTLIDVPRSPAVEALVTGEKMDFRIEGRTVYVIDADGNIVGRLEPKLGQRLAELINGGNRYIAAISQTDPRSVRLLIRETYQDPSQRGRISFPGKLGEGAMYVSSLRYEEYEDVIDDDDSSDDDDTSVEEYIGGAEEEEELGLEEIDPDMGDEDDNIEE